jgi:hypothetical protein
MSGASPPFADVRELALRQAVAELGRELESAGPLWLTTGDISVRVGRAIYGARPDAGAVVRGANLAEASRNARIFESSLRRTGAHA